MLVCDTANAIRGTGMHATRVLSAYARSMRCPVLRPAVCYQAVQAEKALVAMRVELDRLKIRNR